MELGISPIVTSSLIMQVRQSTNQIADDIVVLQLAFHWSIAVTFSNWPVVCIHEVVSLPPRSPYMYTAVVCVNLNINIVVSCISLAVYTIFSLFSFEVEV